MIVSSADRPSRFSLWEALRRLLHVDACRRAIGRGARALWCARHPCRHVWRAGVSPSPQLRRGPSMTVRRSQTGKHMLAAHTLQHCLRWLSFPARRAPVSQVDWKPFNGVSIIFTRYVTFIFNIYFIFSGCCIGAPSLAGNHFDWSWTGPRPRGQGPPCAVGRQRLHGHRRLPTTTAAPPA